MKNLIISFLAFFCFSCALNPRALPPLRRMKHYLQCYAELNTRALNIMDPLVEGKPSAIREAEEIKRQHDKLMIDMESTFKELNDDEIYEITGYARKIRDENGNFFALTRLFNILKYRAENNASPKEN